MERMKMQSANKVAEHIEAIGKLFPNCITERMSAGGGPPSKAIDFDVLRQELSDVLVEGPEERYQFTWPDKRNAILTANAPINKTLRPYREESVDFDNTENLYIEGDNLEVLKLLQETYLGKVKMIYIDPPYNTGSDFVYKDKRYIEANKYAQNSGQTDDEGNRLVQNPESNGRYHTDWLNMMYPRLKVARDLLSDDGVIFISIDDNEVHNLRKICDDLLGIDNFICEFPRVTKRGGKSTNTYAKNHDYVLVYCKDISFVKIIGIEHFDAGFNKKDDFFDKRGPYKLNQTLDYNSLQYNSTMDFPIKINGIEYIPGGDITLYHDRHNGNHGVHDWVWRWSQKKFDFGYKNGWIVVSKTGRIYTKTYLNASIEKNELGKYYIEYSDRKKAVSSLEITDNVYSNDNSIKEFRAVMGTSLFEYVKPTSLIDIFLNTCVQNDAIILDFFSGSATTAHAVMQLNAEDGGQRKFIMVQLPELTDEKSEAYKAGYKNICEIGKERIRRAGKKIKEEHPEAKDLDIGFRVLKCDTSNMEDVYYTPAQYIGKEMNLFVNNVKADRSAEDLLFQCMLELDTPLSAKIEKKIIGGKTVYDVAEGHLMACFDDNVTDEVITEIAQLMPSYFVMRDSSMADDSVAANFEQIFNTYSPNTERRVL